jgi:hypothetical protein
MSRQRLAPVSDGRHGLGGTSWTRSPKTVMAGGGEAAPAPVARGPQHRAVAVRAPAASIVVVRMLISIRRDVLPMVRFRAFRDPSASDLATRRCTHGSWTTGRVKTSPAPGM